MSNKLSKKDNNNDGDKRLSFGFKMTTIKDKVGKKMKLREVTWTDLAILATIKAIKCPVFLSFVQAEDDIYYAIFTDAFNKEGPDVYYAIKLGDYNTVAGSYIKHDSEETLALWEKMMPVKEVKIE